MLFPVLFFLYSVLPFPVLRTGFVTQSRLIFYRVANLEAPVNSLTFRILSTLTSDFQVDRLSI